jgi:rhodanese-related sulfurtransferase
MGPLVPDIIGNELNLVVALLIGIAFGFILEQAGFSTSKKLVGLFYGYDFTVLRVFFTAGITAMIGVIAFGHFGLLDLNLIYVNPTYIGSAIVGGLIMGLGFVIGGFCPGTSVCAAAIGKIDAMIFIAGSFLGVFIFAEGYIYLEDFYKSGFWGYPHMFETLGMSQSAFAVIMTVFAVLAFIVTTMIEKKVNKISDPNYYSPKRYLGIALATIFISFTAFLMPERQSDILSRASDKNVLSTFHPEKMTTDEFAFRIIDGDKKLNIIDLRSKEDFTQMSFPNSVNMNYENLFGKDAAKTFSKKNASYVIIANTEDEETKAAYIAGEIGYENVYVLSDGMNGFRDNVINFKAPQNTGTRHEADLYNFREKAGKLIPEIIKENKNKGVQENKESKRALGGC